MGGEEDGCMEQAGGTVSNSPVTALRVPCKVWSSRTNGYYSATERKEGRILAISWKNLENVPSEGSQLQKD